MEKGEEENGTRRGKEASGGRRAAAGLTLQRGRRGWRRLEGEERAARPTRAKGSKRRGRIDGASERGRRNRRACVGVVAALGLAGFAALATVQWHEREASGEKGHGTARQRRADDRDRKARRPARAGERPDDQAERVHNGVLAKNGANSERWRPAIGGLNVRLQPESSNSFRYTYR